MNSIAIELYETLQTVQSPGNFYATGTLEVFPPHLEVEGVGRIALPLLAMQAEQLVAISQVAPYGLGPKTLVDTQVRRTWQIDASQVLLGGKHWQRNLDDMVTLAATKLGVTGDVRAELYKLLVYEEGCFFVSHRDTEKAAGMFATMVVVLPSEYRGGELVIRHREAEVKLDLHCEDVSEISFAAFYADCVHEVLPITMGYRLTLIYNLFRTDLRLPVPQPPDYRSEQEEVADLLRNWAAELDADPRALPEKLIYLLEHGYSSAELGFDTLKGTDAAIAEVLLAAAEKASCEIHLALVSAEESGSAEYGGYGRYRDDDNFEVGEIIDRIETISAWRRPDGKPSPLPDMPFCAEEFCPPDAFSDIEFDDVQFQEATGNAGASFERSYHCAALVLWPKMRQLAIINKAGFSAGLSVLREICQQLETGPHDSRLREQAHLLAGYMLRDWLPNSLSIQYARASDSQVCEFLNCLHRLRDGTHLEIFWCMLAQKGVYQKNSCFVLGQTAAWLPWETVASCATKAIDNSVAEAFEACATLLASLCLNQPEHAKDLHAAALALFKALPGDPARFVQLNRWQLASKHATPDLVADVLQSFSVIDAALAEQALNYMLAWPAVYAMDTILAPVAGRLSNCASPVVARLRNAVMVHFETRIAETLVPFQDWKRPSQLSCSCQDCAQLSTFLNNPLLSNWIFKAAQARRSHIENIIKNCLCDVDFITLCKSSPYSLVCSKNEASYLRRVEQRKHDLNTLASLKLDVEPIDPGKSP